MDEVRGNVECTVGGVPDRRRFGHVNVICGCSIHMCGWEGDKKGTIGTEQGD
jgi:hypothetical protein